MLCMYVCMDVYDKISHSLNIKESAAEFNENIRVQQYSASLNIPTSNSFHNMFLWSETFQLIKMLIFQAYVRT